MKDQLDIPFPKYHFEIDKAKVSMLQAELQKCYEIIEKQKRTISTYKGHFTKHKNKNNPLTLIKMTSLTAIQNLDKFLSEAILSFQRKHAGKRPDYILVTLSNWAEILRHSHSLKNTRFQHEPDSLKYKGIPVIAVSDGLKEDTIKLVTE